GRAGDQSGHRRGGEPRGRRRMSAGADLADAGRAVRPAQVKVWDPLVRVFHWSLVTSFAFAFLTGDEWRRAHITAGYVVAGLIGFRLLWGLVGPRYARFTSFVRGPGETLIYLRHALALQTRRHLGHNPAGGAMIVVLLVSIGAIAATGYL